MKVMSNPRSRGISSVRANGADANRILADLQTTFQAFKEERTKELADINAKLGDVVQTEKVDRINAEIGSLQKSLDEVNLALAASKLGGGHNERDPDQIAHSAAFSQFFRKGVENGLKDLEVKAKLNTQVDSDGGFLVPEETEAGIDRVLGNVSAIRSVARVVSISGDTYKKLVSMGGAGSGWVSEKEKREETSTPTLREISINSGELYANPAITQRLLDDAAFDIAAWLAEEVSIEFAEQEGAAFINGNGIEKPRGILSYDMVADANYAWGKLGFIKSGKAGGFVDASATASPVDALIDVHGALKRGYRSNAHWLMSDKTETQVRKFKNADGEFIWAPPTATRDVSTILGKPVITDDNMPDVAANAFPIAFGDFNRGYLITDRLGVRVLRDPYTSKPNVLFYTTKRVGGGIANFEALKLLKIAA